MSKRDGLLGGAAAALGALLAVSAPAVAQNGNILEPATVIEAKLLDGTFDVLDQRGSRFEGDRTNRAALSFADSGMMVVKWAPAARGGDEFNNTPRYEVAAYEVQKLFLDEQDYVVPPTVVRAFPVDWYRRLDPEARPTFPRTESVLVTLQYWLFNVTGDSVWDEDRFAADTTYARHFANLNILTYLIRHNDANAGNLLISRSDERRVFAVDNGLAFTSVTSDRGATWRTMQVESLPAGTVARLRALTEDQVREALGVLTQFRIEADGTLTRVPPTANIGRNQGVRQNREVIQLGLTEREVRDLWHRLQSLLTDVDKGRYRLF